MAITPLDLFRAGNASSPKLDLVRSSDLTIFSQNGVHWVAGRSGGVSTFDTMNPTLSGVWWRLPARSNYDDTALFLRNDQDDVDHWTWEPEHDMPLATYRAALAAVNARFIKV